MKKQPILTVSNLNPLGDALKSLDNLTNAWKEYAITSELEQTKREQIKSFRDVNIKSIEENSAILKEYLKLAFQERAGVIQGMFNHLDQALSVGDNIRSAEAIAAIVSLTKSSPLMEARVLIASMSDPSVKMIEI